MIVVVATLTGSSPLTRGKPRPRLRSRSRQRLIPAHAGKTRFHRRNAQGRKAHPRSRGENLPECGRGGLGLGSSPLTRGKRATKSRRPCNDRLIPAHAGKTLPAASASCAYPAHPRSRGENGRIDQGEPGQCGSSPLTRGKPERRLYRAKRRRLIPAHAGKTTFQTCPLLSSGAHPRSRGENRAGNRNPVMETGSSPLTRGKLYADAVGPTGTRLIPAHAGKTRVLEPHPVGCQAHPRSRGENKMQSRELTTDAGSSPLTRGKLRAAGKPGIRRRLIPAHAGKTRAHPCGPARKRAHPRSRGENRL